MTRTLLLRLAGPMQSWGTHSRFRERDCGREPSKSGVVGLLCAALGKPRDEATEHPGDFPALARLAALRMGVRVDREGAVMRDYHTAGGTHGRDPAPYGVVTADGKPGATALSNRYYLADASFLVGLESDDAELLSRLHEALLRPRWQIFLGRKSFVPASPVWLADGLRDAPLLDALRDYQWPEGEGDESPARLPAVVDAGGDDGEAVEVRQDWPESFAGRRFTVRRVRTLWLDRPEGGA